MSRLDFAAHLAVLMVGVGLVNFFGPSFLEEARGQSTGQRLWATHGLIIIANMAGFWYSQRLLTRRYRDIFGQDRLSFFWRSLLRFSLLSPLLGVQTLLIGLLTPGSPRKRGPGWIIRVALLIIGFLLVHVAWLGWRLARKEIRMNSDRVSFVETARVPETIRPLAEALRRHGRIEEFRRAHDWAMIHLLPYLSPSLRMGNAVLHDYDRAHALSNLSDATLKTLCPKRRVYLGTEVDDCHWTLFLKMNETDPGATPYPALILEIKRRTDQQAQRSAEVKELSAQVAVLDQAGDAESGKLQEKLKTAESVVGLARRTIIESVMLLENLLTVVEFNVTRKSAREITGPLLLLPYWGNAEVPFMEMMQDVQRVVLAQLAGSQVRSRLPEVRESIEQAKSLFDTDTYERIKNKLAEIDTRLMRLSAVTFLGRTRVALPNASAEAPER